MNGYVWVGELVVTYGWRDGANGSPASTHSAVGIVDYYAQSLEDGDQVIIEILAFETLMIKLLKLGRFFNFLIF